MATPLRYRHPKFVGVVEGLQQTLRDAAPGEVIDVPESLDDFAPVRPQRAIAGIVTTLKAMAGRSMLLVDGGCGWNGLVGSTATIPPRLRPPRLS